MGSGGGPVDGLPLAKPGIKEGDRSILHGAIFLFLWELSTQTSTETDGAKRDNNPKLISVLTGTFTALVHTSGTTAVTRSSILHLTAFSSRYQVKQGASKIMPF